MEHITELLADYIDNKLTDEQNNTIAIHLKACTECQQEFKQLQALFAAFKAEEVTLPSSHLEQNFLKALEEEQQINTKQKEQTNFSYFLKIAAGVALLIGAFSMGRYTHMRQANDDLIVQQNRTMEVQQTAMISLLENQSASKRIQGVNLITEFENPDEEIVNALANRMFLDDNTNVRLTAVEALSAFASSETVKTAFIKALATEKDPSVQIAIIENLVRIQARKAAEPMRRLLELEETQPFVKAEINRVLPELI